MRQVLHHYNEDHNTKSAEELIAYIIKMLTPPPKSTIDIGCGPGQWLQVFQDFGVQNILGIDGFHVTLDILKIKQSEFMPCDLRKISFDLINKRFDLLLSLEVAEHLEEKYADNFVKTLTDLSDTIIFSAAIPDQSGENHFNEQYPDYWQEKFSKYGYVFLDPFREKFWQNQDVNWWYRQNMFLVIKEENAHLYPYPYNGNCYIHPELFDIQSQRLKAYEARERSIAKSFRQLIKAIFKKNKA